MEEISMARKKEQQEIDGFGERPEMGNPRRPYELKTRYDRPLDQVVSCLQKAIRRGDEILAYSMAFEMCTSGYAKYFFTRLGIIVTEDIAEPQMIMLVDACANMYQRRLKSPTKWSEGPYSYEIVSRVIMELCRAKKSRESCEFGGYVQRMVERNGPPPIPVYAVDMHTGEGRQRIKEEELTDEETSMIWWLSSGLIENAAPGGSKYIQRDIESNPAMGAEAKAYCLKLWKEIYGDDEEG